MAASSSPATIRPWFWSRVTSVGLAGRRAASSRRRAISRASGSPGSVYGIHSDVVAEQVAGDRLAVARAGQRVHGRRVGVDHEPAGDERVEHALHGRPPGRPRPAAARPSRPA